MKLHRALLLLALSFPAIAQSDLRFSDLSGWWIANPTHGGESSPVTLQFLEKDGKHEAHVSLIAIGAYDINLGEVVIDGNSIATRGLAFPMTWNPATKTLSGRIPAEAAPVYDIPIEFGKGAAVERPAPRDWKAAAPRPKVRWTFDTGAAVWAGLEWDAITGLLFVANERGDVHAIDAKGKARWKFETGKPIRGQPRVIGKHVYVASDSGYLHELQIETGAETWRARIDHGSEPRIPTDQEKTRWDRYGSSVVTNGRTLYVASRDGNLYALDLATGEEQWRVAAGDIMTATPALHGDTVIFAAYDGKVRAVSTRDGAPRWTYDAKLAVPGDLVVAGDRVLVGSRSYDLIALDAGSGQELWKRYYWFSWIESPPVIRDGVVYTGSSDATHLYAFDLADGAPRWKSPVPGFAWQRPAVNEGLVIAGTVGQGAYPGSRAGSLIALDRATGALRWIHVDPPAGEHARANEYWGFGAAPVVAGKVVYAADLDGKVFAFETR